MPRSDEETYTLQWNPRRKTKLQHHFHSLNECMNLDKIKPRKHKPCNPLAPNLLSVQRASVKNVPFSWSCQVPCFVTEPPWCDGTWRLRLCQPHSFLFSIHTRPCPDYLLRLFFFFFLWHMALSVLVKRGQMGSKDLNASAGPWAGLGVCCLLLSHSSGDVAFAKV